MCSSSLLATHTSRPAPLSAWTTRSSRPTAHAPAAHRRTPRRRRRRRRARRHAARAQRADPDRLRRPRRPRRPTRPPAGDGADPERPVEPTTRRKALEPTTWDAAKRHAMLLLPSAAASRDTGTVNEPPTPVLEPTSRDAPAALSASSAPASRDAPMRDHQYCVNCRQRRGDERCIRCNLHPLCTRCMPMHWCNQRSQEGRADLR